MSIINISVDLPEEENTDNTSEKSINVDVHFYQSHWVFPCDKNALKYAQQQMRDNKHLPDNAWQLCKFQHNVPADATYNGTEEIEYPEYDRSLDCRISNVLDLLFTVVEESDMAEEVFVAALVEYWIMTHTNTFVNKLAELVYAFDGIVAKLLKRSLELWQLDYRAPR